MKIETKVGGSSRRRNIDSVNLKSLKCLVFVLFVIVGFGSKGVVAGKDRDRQDRVAERTSEEIGIQDNDPAGSNPAVMSTGPGIQIGGSGHSSLGSGLGMGMGMGMGTASSHNKYEKYMDKYGEKYTSGDSKYKDKYNGEKYQDKYGDNYQDKYGSSSSGSSSGSSIFPSSAQQHSSAINYYSAYGYPNSNGNPYNYNNPASQSQQGSNNYYNHYNMMEPYSERYGRDYSTRSSNNIAMAASNSNYGYDSSEFRDQAMASSGGHGWGWKGHSGYNGSKVDTSAIGLLGLIGLFSLMQGVLMTLTTTTTTTAAMMMGRKKRDVAGAGDDSRSDLTREIPQEDGVQRANRISLMVLPALNVIAYAREGRIPLDCAHREMCLTNQMLVSELGVQGRSVGSLMSSAVTKLLKEADNSGEIGKHITKASLAGRSGEDCKVVYPVCDALKDAGAYSLPLLMQPHHLAHITPINKNKRHKESKIVQKSKPIKV